MVTSRKSGKVISRKISAKSSGVKPSSTKTSGATAPAGTYFKFIKISNLSDRRYDEFLESYGGEYVDVKDWGIDSSTYVSVQENLGDGVSKPPAGSKKIKVKTAAEDGYYAYRNVTGWLSPKGVLYIENEEIEKAYGRNVKDGY